MNENEIRGDENFTCRISSFSKSAKSKRSSDFVKLKRIGFITATIAVIFSATLVRSQTASSSSSAVAPFLGRWDLTLKTPDRDYPSWLEVREDDGQLKAQMVGRAAETCRVRVPVMG